MLPSDQKLDELLFVGSDKGYVVFFPLTPLCGYLLPKAAYRKIIVQTYRRIMIIGLIPAVVSIAWTLIWPGHAFLIAVGLVFDVLLAHAMTARVRRRLWKLPVGTGFRFFARWSNPVRRWQGLFTGLMMTFIPFPQFDMTFVLMRGLGVYWTISNTCLIVSRHLHNSDRSAAVGAHQPDSLNSTSTDSAGGSFPR